MLSSVLSRKGRDSTEYFMSASGFQWDFHGGFRVSCLQGMRIMTVASVRCVRSINLKKKGAPIQIKENLWTCLRSKQPAYERKDSLVYNPNKELFSTLSLSSTHLWRLYVTYWYMVYWNRTCTE
jgi:hypothetical protein